MKLTDIPPHITELPNKPRIFWWAFKDAYGEWPQEEEIRPLWHLSYYDGPLSGIVECRGRYFYTRHVYDEDRKWWVAWELTPDEWAREKARHAAFEEHVGSHTTYINTDEHGWVRNPGMRTKPESEWSKFYKNPDIPKVDYKTEVETRDIFCILPSPFYNW